MTTSQDKYNALHKALSDLGFELQIKTPNHLGAIIRLTIQNDELETELDFIFNHNMAFKQLDITPLNYDVTYVDPL